VTEDTDANAELYGRKISNKEIMDSKMTIPASARPFIHTLDNLSSRK